MPDRDRRLRPRARGVRTRRASRGGRRSSTARSRCSRSADPTRRACARSRRRSASRTPRSRTTSARSRSCSSRSTASPSARSARDDPAEPDDDSRRDHARVRRVNREVAGLVQLYSTLVARRSRRGIPPRASSRPSVSPALRQDLAARVRHNQSSGPHPRRRRPRCRRRAGHRRIRRPADPVAARSACRRRMPR